MPLHAEIRILRCAFRHKMKLGFAENVGKCVTVAVFDDFFGYFNAVALNGKGIKRINLKNFGKFHPILLFHVFDRFVTAPENRHFGNDRLVTQKIDRKTAFFLAADKRVNVFSSAHAVNHAFLVRGIFRGTFYSGDFF